MPHPILRVALGALLVAFAEPWGESYGWKGAKAAPRAPRASPVLSASSSASALPYSASCEEAVSVERLSESIARPKVDGREYRLVRLANGLVALLVSDADADEAGAALSVKAGSFDDTRLGIAHFHEHMLFLGTKKYPSEEEFEEYLSGHGGSSNAYTADEETCYYLSVNAGALDGALDRFAQFFVAPLLLESCVQREVKAVDSEHAMALNDDGWRLLSVLKTTVDKRHPFSRFSTGTERTLLTGQDQGFQLEETAAQPASSVSTSTETQPDALLTELKRWHEEHYVGAAMRLCVVGKEPLDELERLVSAPGRFGAVRRGALKRDSVSRPSPWPYASLAREIDVVPVRQLRVLQLMWPLPPRAARSRAWASTLQDSVAYDQDSSESSTPELVISHLLGHEGASTLHSALRALGYVDSLSCGVAASFDDAQLFELTLELTELGEERRSEVVEACWRWVGVVARAEPSELRSRASELRQLHATRFDYSERRAAADHASFSAEALWEHPTQPLSGPSLVGPDDDCALQALLDALAPENALLVNVLPGLTDEDEACDDQDDDEACASPLEAAWRSEKWHGARFRSKAAEPAALERWRLARSGELAFRDERHAAELGKLALPALNKFVPSSLHVLPQTGRGCYRVPREAFEALEDDESLTLWRRADYGDAAASVRRVPKSFANALLRSADSPHAHQDARSIVLCKCFCALVSSRLNHESYDAALAGLSVSLDAGRTSLAVRCSGFSDNLPVLWARALDKLAADASCYSQTDTGETSDDDDAREAAAEFERERAALARRCDDAQRDEPATRVAQWADFVLEEELEPVSAHSLRAAIREESRDAAADSLKRAALDVLQRVAHARLEVYVAGNADDATANQLATAVRTARTHARRACAALPVVARAADDDAVVQAADVVTVAGVTTPRCLVLPVGDGGVAVELRALRPEEQPTPRFLGQDAAKASDEDEDDEDKDALQGAKSDAFDDEDEFEDEEQGDDPNSAVELLWQMFRSGDDAEAASTGWVAAENRDATATLLGRLASTSAFNQLRTVEQNGYIADASLDAKRGVLCFTVTLQSSLRGPLELERRIEGWLALFRTELEQLSDDDVDRKRQGLADALLQRAAALRDVVSRDWHEIASKRRRFSHVKRRARNIRGVTREQLLKLLDDHLVLGAPKRRLLRSRVYAPAVADAAVADPAAHALLDPATLTLRSLEEIREFKKAHESWLPPLQWDEGAGPSTPAE